MALIQRFGQIEWVVRRERFGGTSGGGGADSGGWIDSYLVNGVLIMTIEAGGGRPMRCISYTAANIGAAL